jgi:hypothetical protein
VIEVKTVPDVVGYVLKMILTTVCYNTGILPISYAFANNTSDTYPVSEIKINLKETT